MTLRAAVFLPTQAYLHHLLNHVNQYTKVALKDEPAILAWETGNELHEGSGVPFTNWTQAIAGYLRSELGAKQLILDGRAGMSPAAVHGNPDVDMLSDHFYGGWSSAIAATKIDSVAVNSGNKVECRRIFAVLCWLAVSPGVMAAAVDSSAVTAV